jgi:hypothetical protein
VYVSIAAIGVRNVTVGGMELQVAGDGKTWTEKGIFVRKLGKSVGTWLSLVERCVRDAEVAGSNPVVPTKDINRLRIAFD